MKQLVSSIFVAGLLLKVLINTNDLMTRVIVIPFIVFDVALGLKNVLILMKKETLAIKVSKVYVIAFLLYWFGFLIYWDYVSFIDGKYKQILFSIPLWLGGYYFTYKRLVRKTK